MVQKNPIKKNVRIVLIDDPLTTNNEAFLEDILSKANGCKYLDAVQFGSLGGNYGIPTDSDKEPLNKHLAGGMVIRARYEFEEIRERYRELKVA
ncbi:hypothetical protein HQ545_01165 [Candidatus Woesearchaeota archaeon]|nr:hypothetical protein [Candidatus Woesearchaeota archaeon]